MHSGLLREVCENVYLVLTGNHGTPSFNSVQKSS